ncbi:ABC transporter substrate-binding protein [Alphaproteobacteria bacterium]|jgi:alpha-1,4-digalacturonate transport system substrate-binding protein|nr:ABC transporter substrate-binding protein [Alphaproteobacteria bacterium]
MQKLIGKIAGTLAIGMGMSVSAAGMAQAANISFLCYNNNVECETFEHLAKGWTKETGHTMEMEVVAYEVIREQLLLQVESGETQDVWRFTGTGKMAPHLLDLTPYVDGNYWEENYGAVLGDARVVTGDNGIYMWPTQQTATGTYVNVTMFEDAGVDMPEKGATWEDWADALRQVKSELDITAGLCFDRTGHRWAGPAASYGANFLDENGDFIFVDDGFTAFSKMFVGWHEEGLMPQEGWPAASGTKYKNCAPLFLDGTVAMHMSGSWMIGSYTKNITSFEWKAVPIPCGPAGCGVVPGGAQLGGWKGTKEPEAVASFIDYMARTENAEYMAQQTSSISGHRGLQISGVDYSKLDPKVGQSLATFAGNLATALESGLRIQSHPQNFAVWNGVPEYLTKAIDGDMSLDEALVALDADMKAKNAN